MIKKYEKYLIFLSFLSNFYAIFEGEAVAEFE